LIYRKREGVRSVDIFTEANGRLFLAARIGGRGKEAGGIVCVYACIQLSSYTPPPPPAARTVTKHFLLSFLPVLFLLFFFFCSKKKIKKEKRGKEKEEGREERRGMLGDRILGGRREGWIGG